MPRAPYYYGRGERDGRGSLILAYGVVEDNPKKGKGDGRYLHWG